METLISFPGGIHTIDALYQRPRLAAIHLIVERGRAALFDTGTNFSLPQVRQALVQLGLGDDSVDYVIPSHVHLDHAGGAGAMMQAFPQARLVVHPRGARHMADPSKLVAGTVAVYGAAATHQLYGEILPVAPQRIVEATEGLEIDLAGRRLRVLDTPGHARHHICLFDESTRSIFAGDMFGLSYREFDVDGRASILPTTTPVQFDPELMHASIDRLRALQPAAIYLTHFSRVTDIERLAADLHRLIDQHVACAVALAELPREQRHGALLRALRTLILEEKRRQRWRIEEAQMFELLDADLELNAQGLEIWLDGRGVNGTCGPERPPASPPQSTP